MKIDIIKHTPMKILLEDYYFIYYKTGQIIKINKGFAFDGASVPQIFSWIFPPNSTDILEDGLEHDYLYSKLCLECTNRKDADLHFMSKLKPLWTKILAYIGVRLGGWLSFKKDTNYNKYKKEIEEVRKNLIINKS